MTFPLMTLTGPSKGSISISRESPSRLKAPEECPLT
jgi:hypothetical protein